MPNKRILAIILVLAVSLVAGLGHGQEKKEDKKGQDVSALMKKKLAASQKILEGLTQNDFELIIQNADALHDISREASFKALHTPRYEIYAEDFQRSAEKLRKAGKDKNLDAAALAYVDLTLNCVKCHQHVREVRMTKLNDDFREFSAVGR
jgi:cytochrome c556